VVLGEEECAQGMVKVKEMGLREGHPEKEGVLVKTSDLVPEIRKRLARKAEIDGMTKEAEGLRVVGGIKGEPLEPKEDAAADQKTASPETIGAVPAS
jgi:histidyl-tRNA synthetase